MDKIESVPGRFLYLAHQMLEDNSLTKKQQSLFKDLILSMSPSLLQAHEDYQVNGTELTLRSDVMRIIRKQKENENWDSESSNSKKSSKKGRAMKIIIPAKNIQKLPAEIERIQR